MSLIPTLSSWEALQLEAFGRLCHSLGVVTPAEIVVTIRSGLLIRSALVVTVGSTLKWLLLFGVERSFVIR